MIQEEYENKPKGFELKTRIEQLHAEGYTVVDICKALNISRQTFYNHKAKDIDDYDSKKTRERSQKRYEAYKPIIKSFLEVKPNGTIAQVCNKLVEHFEELYGDEDFNLDINYSTVRRYVEIIRKEYSIPKKVVIPQVRDYVMRPVCRPGNSMEVDFGEQFLMTPGGKRIKVHFIVFVLNYSKFCYVYFLNKHFTAKQAADAHRKAFIYFGGITDKIVYDQDKLFLVNEDIGNFKHTTEFDMLVKEFDFMAVFCHKSDPESKGLVENSVSFVKHNFLDGTVDYKSLDKLNSDALKWCRRVSKRVHGTAKKQPIELFKIEKQHLKPVDVSCDYLPFILTHSVNKYNSVNYLGNKYSVPYGSYSKGIRYVNLVIRTEIDKDYIQFYEVDTGVFITEHLVVPGSGNIISKPEHRGEDARQEKIKELVKNIAKRFSNPIVAINYCDKIIDKYGPYRREKQQLEHLLQLATLFDELINNQTLDYCIKHSLFDSTVYERVAKTKSGKQYHELQLKNQKIRDEIETRNKEKQQLDKEAYFKQLALKIGDNKNDK